MAGTTSRSDAPFPPLSAALDELYGLGHQNTDTEDTHYEAVTLDQTRAVAQKYLKPETVVIAVIQPAKAPGGA